MTTDARPRARSLRINAGFAICALAGVLVTIAQSRPAVDGVVDGLPRRYSFSSSLALFGIVAIVVFGYLAVRGWDGWRIAGLALAGAAAGYVGLLAVGMRVSKDYDRGTDTTLLLGGQLIVAAGIALVVGLAVAAFVPSWSSSHLSPNVAIACAIAGVLLVPLAAVGIGLGMRARADTDGDEPGGRKGAAAVVLGAVILAGWVFGIGIGIGLANP